MPPAMLHTQAASEGGSDAASEAAHDGGSPAAHDAAHDAAHECRTRCHDRGRPRRRRGSRCRTGALLRGRRDPAPRHLDRVHRGAGISEFDSPTYYGTDLESLWVGYQFAPASEQATFGAIWPRSWEDIAASALVPHGGLVGPYSRVLDFFRGHGDLETGLYLEGLRLGPPVLVDRRRRLRCRLRAPEHRAGRLPPRPRHALPVAGDARGPVAVRRQPGRRDRAPAGHPSSRRNWALGSTSSNYDLGVPNNQDEMIQAAFASVRHAVRHRPSRRPRQSRHRPLRREAEAAPTHLALNPRPRRRGGAMLVLLRIDTSDPEEHRRRWGPSPCRQPVDERDVPVGGRRGLWWTAPTSTPLPRSRSPRC